MTVSPQQAAHVRFVLGSASPARLKTLRNAGVQPDVIVSEVDEPAVLAAERAKRPDLTVAECALVLARAKCEDVAARVAATLVGRTAAAAPHTDAAFGHLPGQAETPRTVVLGCDSLFELDGEALGKPTDAEDARARWARMSGRSGVLHTGHWLIDAANPIATVGRTVSTEVDFASVSAGEIDAYVATEEPLWVAGAFTVDGLGGPFVTGVRGDFHNVVGVSLPQLRLMLGELGVAWSQLWTDRPE